MIFEIIRSASILQLFFEIGRGRSFSTAHFGCSACNVDGEFLPFALEVHEITEPHDRLRKFRALLLFECSAHPEQPQATRIW